MPAHTFSADQLANMGKVSRALVLGHLDRAYVILTESFCSGTVAAAFLLESGCALQELPRAARAAIATAAARAA